MSGRTEPSANHAHVLALCRDDQTTDALLSAFRERDPIGMLVASIFDTGNSQRLELLIESHPELATEIVLDGVRRNDETHCVSTLAFGILGHGVHRLPLTFSQANDLLTRVADANDPVAPVYAAHVLQWVADRQPSAATAFAHRYVTGAPCDTLSELDRAVADLLGASSDHVDHACLLDYAQRCAETGQFASHDTLIGGLEDLADSDVEAIGEQWKYYVAANQPPGNRQLGALAGLAIAQVALLAVPLSDPAGQTWLTSHVVPTLFAAHGSELASTLDAPWWPAPALDWLLTAAEWSSCATHLPSALDAAKRRADPTRVSQVRQLIVQQTQAAPADLDTKSTMPRLGARTLLTEALRGDLDPTDDALRAAVGHLSPPLRISEYVAASWKQPERAQRMGAIVAAVLIDEVVELTDALRDLTPTARISFLRAAGPLLTTVVAGHLADVFLDDEATLAALTSSDVGRQTILALWRDAPKLPWFRALAAAEEDARLTPVPEFVRDYSNGLSAAERRELLTDLGVSDARYGQLVEILVDWNGFPRPDDDTVAAALDLAGEHLANGVDPDSIVDAAESLSSASLGVRTALYRALARATPTPKLVALVKSRQEGEPAAGRAAVTSAAVSITERLVAIADTQDPQQAIEGLRMLDTIDPAAALPIARRLARECPAPDDRITAIRIVGAHGTRETDPQLLSAIADGDEADGDPAVRREATRALRRLEIGDLAAAHEKLGELAGLDAGDWTDHDPALLYGSWGEAIREGLDRVAQAETDENWAYGIDQLDEIAKVLLYRALETAGTGIPSIAGQVQKAMSRDLNSYGSVVGSQQLSQQWSWVRFFTAIHEKRAAHIVQSGTSSPPPTRSSEDFRAALVAFRDGSGPCLTLIASHTP